MSLYLNRARIIKIQITYRFLIVVVTLPVEGQVPQVNGQSFLTQSNEEEEEPQCLKKSAQFEYTLEQAIMKKKGKSYLVA